MKKKPNFENLTKQELIEELEKLRTGDYDIDDYVLKILFNFGELAFLNASIPVHGGEIELREYFNNNPKPKNALVIRYNRGVSAGMIAQYCEKVTAIDTVASEIAPQIAEYLELDNVKFIQAKDRQDMLTQITADKYDFIYLESGVDYDNMPPQFTKIGKFIYVYEYEKKEEVKPVKKKTATKKRATRKRTAKKKENIE